MKDGIAVIAAGREAGYLLDGFADTDAEARQYLPYIQVGVWAAAGHDQRGNAVRRKPHVTEIDVRFLVSTNIISYIPDHKRQEDKHYYVYMTAATNKFLRIYYGTGTACLEKL